MNIGKLRSEIASVRPWLGKINTYREIISEFLGKGANKFASVPFIGEMAKRAKDVVDSLEEPLKVYDTAGEIMDSVNIGDVKGLGNMAKSNPLAFADGALAITDQAASFAQGAVNKINKFATDNPTIANMLLDKPIDNRAVIQSSYVGKVPMKKAPVGQGVVGKITSKVLKEKKEVSQPLLNGPAFISGKVQKHIDSPATTATYGLNSEENVRFKRRGKK
jgi:hypothetical protein